MGVEIHAKSVVRRVEVLRTGALLTRHVTASLPMDEERITLVVDDLPLGLDEQSIRCKVEQADLRVLDLRLAWSFGQRDGPVRTKLDQNLLELVRKLSGFQVEMDREQERLRFLEGLKIQPVDESSLPDKFAFTQRHQTGPHLELAAWVGRQVSVSRSKIRQLKRRKSDLDDEIARIYDELSRQDEADVEAVAMLGRQVRIELALAGGHDQLSVELSYLIEGVAWAPEYTLRVEQDRDEAQLSLFSLVAQATGEAWDGAEISFSTVNLRRSVKLPILDSWRIGKAQPCRITGWRPLPQDLDSLFEDYLREGRVQQPVTPDVQLPNLPCIPRLGPDVDSAQMGKIHSVGKQEIQSALESRLSADTSVLAETQGGEAYLAQNVEVEKLQLDELADADYDDLIEEEEVEAPVASSYTAPLAPPAMAGSMKLMKESTSFSPNKKSRAMNRITDEEPSIEIEPGVEASDAALDYWHLKMRGPQGSDRGQLAKLSFKERFLDDHQQGQDPVGSALALVDDKTLNSVLEIGRRTVDGVSFPEYAVKASDICADLAVRYGMDGIGFVPADGQIHKLTLLRKNSAVKRVCRCVPYLDKKVYEVVEFENPVGIGLLAGPVRVFKGGQFVVTSALMDTPAGKKLQVNLGIIQGVSVARNTHFYESTEGLFGGDSALIQTVEIETKSNLTRPLVMQVFERIPVADDDDIKIEVLECNPECSDYDQSERGEFIRGGKLFCFDLNPGDSVKCVLKYRVTIPSKLVLVGGNRRV